MAKLSPEERKKARIEAGRKGGKNKKGKRSQHVIDREEALKQFKEGVQRRTHSLLNVQTMLAMGTIQVFRIDYEERGSGQNKYRVGSRPVLVRGEEEIIDALDYEFGQGESPNDETKYYFVTTKDPENKAIDSLLDRTFGKSKETLELVSPIIIDPKEAEKANKTLSAFINKRKK